MFWKILAALLILGVGWVVYDFFTLRAALHQVYTPPEALIQVPQGADLTLVEFLDYSCGASRGAHTIIKEALAKDGMVRFVPRPLVVPGNEQSKTMAELVYAAGIQGGFFKMHERIMETSDDLPALLAYAETIGLDRVQLEKDMAGPEVAQALETNEKFFNDWQFQATPSLLIATDILGTKAMFRGDADGVTVQELLDMFQSARRLFG